MSTSSGRTRGAPVRYLREVLRRYERQVLPVFKRHGGAFERIWTTPADVAEPTTDPEAPDEIPSGSPRGGIRRCRRWPSCATPSCAGAVLVRVADVPLGRYFEDPA